MLEICGVVAGDGGCCDWLGCCCVWLNSIHLSDICCCSTCSLERMISRSILTFWMLLTMSLMILVRADASTSLYCGLIE